MRPFAALCDMFELLFFGLTNSIRRRSARDRSTQLGCRTKIRIAGRDAKSLVAICRRLGVRKTHELLAKRIENMKEKCTEAHLGALAERKCDKRVNAVAALTPVENASPSGSNAEK